jgi:fucose permease
MCGCVPSLKPLVARSLPRIIRNPGETSSSDRGHSTNESTRSTRPQPVASSAGIRTAPDITQGPKNSVREHETVESPASGSAPMADFFILMRPKSMLQMNTRESLLPNSVMCFLFFLWGFAFGFIDVLNARFRVAAGYASRKIFELHAAYFSAYFLGPILVARPILKKWGFRATIVTGLSIYSCGTLVFWPAAALISLPAFFVSNCIVGLGLSVIETAADLFLSLCGPMDHAEMRLNVAQGVQAVGAMVSTFLAQQVLFKDVVDAPGLIKVQWTYLGITIAATLMAVAYNSLPLPEAYPEELKQLADRRRDDFATAVCGIRVVWVTLALGVFSQFCNIGGQEELQTRFHSLVTDNEPR